MMDYIRRGVAPLILAITLLVTGCSSTISNDPVGGLSEDGVIVQDMLAASRTLEKSIEIGVLPEDDPAAACLRDVLTDLDIGVDGVKRESFEPEHKGLISVGAILWVRARQLESTRGEDLSIPTGCKAIIGQIVIDAARVAVKGGGLASSVIKRIVR